MKNIDWMNTLLLGAVIVLVIVAWRAQRSPSIQFNILDLITEGGQISKIAFVFMVAFIVSTWVIVDQQINEKLTEGTFGLWLASWVGPLVVKVVFNKNEMPGSTTLTAVSSKTVEVTEPKNESP